MVKNNKKSCTRNKRSFISMHYDSPVTRSQNAVLDMFKNYNNRISMFSDPTLRSVLEDEMAKNPGRVMTRHMVKHRSIKEIEDLVELAKQRKSKGKSQSSSSPADNCALARNTKSPKSGIMMRSRSSRGQRPLKRLEHNNTGTKRKRKRPKQIRITINDIKFRNLTRGAHGPMEEKGNTTVAHDSQAITDNNGFYIGDALDNITTQLNNFEFREQDTIYSTQNGTTLRNDTNYGRAQDHFCPSRTLEGTAPLRNDMRLGVVHDQFYPCPPIENRIPLRKNVRFEGQQNGVCASRTLGNSAPFRNDATLGKEVDVPTSGFENRQVDCGKGFKATTAEKQLKAGTNYTEAGFHCKGCCFSTREKTGETKTTCCGCQKPKSISLWFDNAVSSVSSYVTRYIPFSS